MKNKNRRNICLDCFYYGMSRYGLRCNYYGIINPYRTECPQFKSIEEGEKEIEKSLETVRLIRTIIIKLSELKPKIKNIADADLKEELLELCLVADMLKERLRI